MKQTFTLMAALVLAVGMVSTGAFAQCDNAGPDSDDGADFIASGTLAVGSEITLQLTIDGEVVEIVESGWWESRANDRDDGGASWHEIDLVDGSAVHTLTEDSIGGYVEATNNGESHWLYYNFDELCLAPPEPPADPTNQGPTSVPVGMPVGGVAGLAMLIIAGASGGAFAIRKRS